MMNVYAIYDKKTCFSQELVCIPNDDVAKRYFGNFVANIVNCEKPSLLVNYPEDFDFYCIGTYDPETGLISDCKPEFIANAASLIRKE